MIEVYTFNYTIDGMLFGGQISAKSWEHAEELVPFAEVDGKLVEEIPFEGSFADALSMVTTIH